MDRETFLRAAITIRQRCCDDAAECRAALWELIDRAEAEADEEGDPGHDEEGGADE